MTDLDKIGEVVASNVASLRKAHGLSMDKLAKVSGVSKGMIVQVEQAKSNASIATLVRLANALGVTVARLVEPTNQSITRKTRIDDATILWQGAAGGSGKLLAGVEEPSLTELWEWRLQPNEAHEGLAHIPGTKEMLLVQTGQLTVSTSAWSETVLARESLVFSADVPHRYCNDGTNETLFIMVVLEPQP